MKKQTKRKELGKALKKLVKKDASSNKIDFRAEDFNRIRKAFLKTKMNPVAKVLLIATIAAKMPEATDKELKEIASMTSTYNNIRRAGKEGREF